MTDAAVLGQRLADRSARLAVIGMGYVGLPLAIEFARAGFAVTAIDTDLRRVDAVNRGESYLEDLTPADVAGPVQSGRLRATGDFAVLSGADVIVICVPTPLRKTKDPDLSYIVAAVSEIKGRLRRGMLVVLESTTYPGTTEELLQPELEARELRVGHDVFLAFSPERVDPGNAHYRTGNIPKVVGGVEPRSTELATALYGAISTQVIPVGSARTAEMVKLLENTFRSVNIALVNEMALLCERMGIDVWEVIGAAATKPFGFMPFYPGPGIGGHCIPLDPSYLSWKAKTYDFFNRLIEVAVDINRNMPRHVVSQVAALLNLNRKSINGSRVLILGVAYKPDVSDTRESPALEVFDLLQQQGAEVSYCDPHVPKLVLPDGAVVQALPTDPRVAAAADIVILLTNHTAFDYPGWAGQARLVYDCRNGFQKVSAPHIYRLGSRVVIPRPNGLRTSDPAKVYAG